MYGNPSRSGDIDEGFGESKWPLECLRWSKELGISRVNCKKGSAKNEGELEMRSPVSGVNLAWKLNCNVRKEERSIPCIARAMADWAASGSRVGEFTEVESEHFQMLPTSVRECKRRSYCIKIIIIRFNDKFIDDLDAILIRSVVMMMIVYLVITHCPIKQRKVALPPSNMVRLFDTYSTVVGLKGTLLSSNIFISVLFPNSLISNKSLVNIWNHESW